MPYWERAEFPFELVPKIAPLNISSSTVRGNGCPGHSVVGAALVVAELARVDASCATFVMVHSSLAMLTISAPPLSGCLLAVGADTIVK